MWSTEVGRFRPKRSAVETLGAGEVGYVIAGIKDIRGAPVGDTLVLASHSEAAALPGFTKAKPQVYAGLFPVNSDRFEDFRAALEKLTLNDCVAVLRTRILGCAGGFGFRCGFLGLLHMEIVQQRLEREYDLDLITSAPTVIYEAELADGSVVEVDNPSRLPERYLALRANRSRR